MKQGFTLVELIVVIAILGIMAALIAPNAVKVLENAKITQAISEMQTYKSSLLALHSDTGHWIMDNRVNDLPLNIGNNDLDANVSNWSNWNGPYVEKIISHNPWKSWYVFSYNLDFNANGYSELRLDAQNICYPTGDNTCPTPRKAKVKIDQTLDDNALFSGKIRNNPTNGNILSYILIDDYR
jgi:general secretion pathway protein G